MKKIVSLALLISLIPVFSYAMEESSDQALTDAAKATITLAQIAAPGFVYLKTGDHAGRYQDAAWVSFGSAFLWQGAKRAFQNLTGTPFVLPEVSNAGKTSWKNAVNTGIRSANTVLDTVVGPIALSFLVQKGMEKLEVPNRRTAPDAPGKK